MSKVLFELNTAGVGELLKSEKLINGLNQIATTVQRRAGKGYGKGSSINKTRATAYVYTATRGAINDNMKRNTLLKSL